MTLTLSTPVQYIKGIGEERARILENKGVFTAEDLLYYIPFRYEDRTRVHGPGEVRAGEMATVIAQVASAGMLPLRRRRMNIFVATVKGGGHFMNAKWFNAAYLQKVIQPGQFLAMHGKVELDPYTHVLEMQQPQVEILPGPPSGDASIADGAGTAAIEASLEIGRIVPIYETAGAGKLNSRFFRKVTHYILESLAGVDDPLPAEVIERYGLIPRWEAIRNIHFPPPGTRLSELDESRTPAHRRLIFEEFFFLEARLALKRKRARETPGISFETDARIRESLKKILPFHPTSAQKRALAEIIADMRAPHPMHRLLQGEVGSGKTIVALQAALIAIENGYQTVLMAPTEVLAMQHFLGFRRLLARTGHNVVLLSGNASAREKAGIKRLLKEGAVEMAIGTHALVEQDVVMKKLGLVIIDEQHRFGVMQRLRLMRKGVRPDTLVMTATPIPRTLAHTLYGDLDVSVINELPAGRLPIRTRRITSEEAHSAYEFVRSQVVAGAQAFIVYPLIEESTTPKEANKRKADPEALDLKSALKMYDYLSREVFPELRVGLMHGRLSADEKDTTMSAFQAGEIQVLVSTTVVEVGVDVPNASVMVIEQADRFGLAQLHQLRGRVGRGSRQSHCLLLCSPVMTEAALERLATLERTNDGFEIAEVDLRLRGPGEFLGTKQAGLPALRIANLIRDKDILEWARQLAMDFIEHGKKEEIDRLVSYLKGGWESRYGLVKSG